MLGGGNAGRKNRGHAVNIAVVVIVALGCNSRDFVVISIHDGILAIIVIGFLK